MKVMKVTGQITLWDVEFVFVVDGENILLIPKEKEDIKKVNSHFCDSNFVVNYFPDVWQATAFIERVEYGTNGAIKLYPKYIIDQCHKKLFAGFEITGEAIDDFFNPSRYFFDRRKKDTEESVDFIYHSEIADKWTVTFEDRPITITLSYGDILRWGIASDLMLHPKLTVDFEKTADTEYVYRVYSFVVRFLQLVRYDTKCGKLRVELFCKEQEKMSYNGKLYDFSMDQNQFYKGNHEVEYGCFKPYVQHFLQFAADSKEYNFSHYPSNGIRYRGRHYSAVDFLNIFSAFESECHASPELYENADTTKIQTVKESLVSFVEEYPSTDLSEEETDFLKNARENLIKQGTEFGQRRKLKIAYGILKEALESSIENIFYLPTFKCKGHLTKKQLGDVVELLVAQRGAIAHGRFVGMFSDLDAQKIHFLEILTYAQMLKRIGLEDKDIERIIGVVFGCNYVVFGERYK